VKPAPLQFEMDWWFPHSREIVSVAEVARVFQISEEQVRNLVDEGKLVAAGIGDKDNPKRVHLRVERWSAVAWRLNALADMGVRPPVRETQQVTWWRAELRKRAEAKCASSDTSHSSHQSHPLIPTPK